MNKREFRYKGKIYIRPMGRGVVLDESEFVQEEVSIDDLAEAIAIVFTGSSIGGGEFYVEITVNEVNDDR